MADNVSGSNFGTNQERTRSEATFESIVEATRRATPAFDQATAAVQRLSLASAAAFDQMSRRTEEWGNTTAVSFARVAELVLRQTGIEQLAAIESGRAEAQKTLLHKAAVQERAVVEAVRQTAEGFAALGDFDFWSAAQHFASAALWGSLAALEVASSLGALGPGGGAGRAPRTRSAPGGYAAGGGGTQPAATAPLMASGLGGSASGGYVVVMDEATFGQFTAAVLTRHVTKRGGTLVASHAARPVSAGA